MRKILLLGAIFATFTAKAQSLVFQIKPVVYKTTMQSEIATITKSLDTCDKITLRVCGIAEDSACVEYYLYKTNGIGFTGGKVNVPLSFMQVAVARPVNIANINAILRNWNIEAVRRVMEN